MELNEFYFVPHSDTGLEEKEIISEHNNLINEGKIEEAVTLLDDANFNKGVRASLLNSIQNKIGKLQSYLRDEFSPNKNVYYSDEEPTLEFMNENGYTIWSKPWD